MTSTILYHFHLTLVVGHMVSTKQNLLASFFHVFQLVRMAFDLVIDQFMINVPRCSRSREVTAVLLTASKSVKLACIQTFMKDLFKLGMTIDTINSTF